MADMQWRDRIRDSKLGNVAVVAITAVLVLGGIYLIKGGPEEPEATQTSEVGGVSEVDLSVPLADPPEVGQKAPGFRALDLEGNPVDLENEFGKPIWLVFNATWCSACRAEVPDMQQVQDEYGEDVTILSIWVNEPADRVEQFTEQLGLSYTHIVDASTEISASYRTMGIPAHYFISSDGTIESIHVGGLSKAQMEDKIQALN